MPIYQYDCKQCTKPFEAIVPAKSADTVTCPDCGTTEITRQLGMPARSQAAATNCRGDGPPCGAAQCGRR